MSPTVLEQYKKLEAEILPIRDDLLEMEAEDEEGSDEYLVLDVKYTALIGKLDTLWRSMTTSERALCERIKV